MTPKPHALIIAGSDSSGGAGVARDIATLSCFGVHASLAVTAVTVQTHAAVSAVEVMPATLVAAQMRAALAAEPVAAIKIGMLATAEIVAAVADVLASHKTIPVILDPVVASTSGTPLLSDAGIECLSTRLLPASALITPNLPELGILTGSRVSRSDAETARQADVLLDKGSANVLVKGGHAEGEQASDTLFAPGRRPRSFRSPRREARLRGTGCMLSSAIAANIALGKSIHVSVARAKAFIDSQFDLSGDCLPEMMPIQAKSADDATGRI